MRVYGQVGVASHHVRAAGPTPGVRPFETQGLIAVEFRLAPEGNGTRLSVVESGFGELSVPVDERDAYVDGNIQGWRDELDELRSYLAA